VSQENVDVVRRYVELHNARDLDSAVDVCTVDVLVLPDRMVFPEAEPVHGRDAFRDLLEGTWESWTVGVVVIREIFEAPDGRVVARTDWEATGAASGLDVATNLTGVFTVRDGQIAVANFYFGHADALKAVGLEEQAVSQEPTTPDLELVRRMIEADTFDEWARIAERFFARDALWEAIGERTFKGREAIVDFVGDYWSTWDDHHHYVEESVDLGDGVIWGIIREHGRIKGSDTYIEARWAFVSLLIEGRCVRFAGYTDLDEGRAAAERLAKDRE
jgi:ketosteroid isomerase-like protein